MLALVVKGAVNCDSPGGGLGRDQTLVDHGPSSVLAQYPALYVVADGDSWSNCKHSIVGINRTITG
jgi:hypothetical protein